MCTFYSTLLDTWAKGRSSHILARHYSDSRFKHKFLTTFFTGDKIWCFTYGPETKRQFYECVGEISHLQKKQIPKVPHQDHVDNYFFDSEGLVHKEFVPEGKTVNAEFYKGVMDNLLKLIQRVCPAAFCCWDFFLLHDNAPTHKAASVCQFLNPQIVTTLYHRPPPVLPRFISARLFSVPQVECEFKRTPICGFCWDPRSHNWWIKEGPKRGIFGSFHKMYDQAKVCIYAKGSYFE